ncbi:MAG: transcriptional regulator [Deltaproteobacteria bacterium]|nr:transcriptional regulator [Deltaproteobacteria bacterium]
MLSIKAVLDQNIQQSDYAGDYVSDQVEKLLAIMNDNWLSRDEMMNKLGLSHQPTFRKNYLKPALNQGLIVMKDPQSPKSPKQKYRKV